MNLFKICLNKMTYRELYRLMPVLAYLSKISDVRRVDQNWKLFEEAEEAIKIRPGSPTIKGRKYKTKFFDKFAFLNNYSKYLMVA